MVVCPRKRGHAPGKSTARSPTNQGGSDSSGQAISNLLANGFKYAPNSGEMTLTAERIGDEVVISVHDQGPGVDGQDQIRLFEKFYRVQRHGSGEVKGSGLGLAIVKTIADRHGGRAWCHSDPDNGSTFYISVPINRTDLQKPAA